MQDPTKKLLGISGIFYKQSLKVNINIYKNKHAIRKNQMSIQKKQSSKFV